MGNLFAWIGFLALVGLSVLCSAGLTFWEWMLMLACAFCIGLLLLVIYINWYGVPSVLLFK